MATKKAKRKSSARAPKKKSGRRPAKKNAARKKKQKSVFLRNFTGRVSQNRDKTISIVGRGHRGR